jgi:hypothetical protein
MYNLAQLCINKVIVKIGINLGNIIRVLEFFDSIVFMVLEIENFEYCTVCSFANFIDDLVLGSYIVDPQRGMFAGIHEFSQVFIYLKT